MGEPAFYTSSEAMRSVIAPSASRATISAPTYSQQSNAMAMYKATYEPLLKPSVVRQITHATASKFNRQEPNRSSGVIDKMQQLSNVRVMSPAGHRQKIKPVANQWSAPYASRVDFAGSVGAAADAGMPLYNSLYDPALQKYFVKKLGVSAKRHNNRSFKPPLSVNQFIYSVSVKTGISSKCGTTANVFIRMFGSKNKSTKQKLTSNRGIIETDYGSRFQFKPGSENEFKILAPELGHIKKIVLEHDGLREKDSWFVEDVEVIQQKTGKVWNFQCNQWFSLYEGDCQVSRELVAKNDAKSMEYTEYEVLVVTGSRMNAGTDANVFLTLYTKDDFSPRSQLKHSLINSNPFEKGHSDTFMLRTKSFDSIKKIRIEHDNTGSAPGWYLEFIKVKNKRSNKETTFNCKNWLAKGEGDGRICRDLVPSDAQTELEKYKIIVHTGDKRGAGTDANVFVTLSDSDGTDSGELPLKGKGNLFEKGSTDKFEFTLPSLSDLASLQIRHDNSGPNSAWYLHKIEVKVGKDQSYEFPCDRWLAKDEDDGKISRILECSNGKSNLTTFAVRVETGSKMNAGTSANVYVMFQGKNSASGKLYLDNGKLKKGRTDEFKVRADKAIAALKTLTIGHDGKGVGDGWYLEKVIVTNEHTGIQQHFPCSKWLAEDEGDGVLEVTLHEDKGMRQKQESKLSWDVTVNTSDIKYAGTDANVFMVLYGKEGASEEIQLDQESDVFERGSSDHFEVSSVDVGQLYKIRVWHDGSGAGSGWHLDSIELTNRSSGESYEFKLDRWLSESDDDHEIVREIPAEGKKIKKILKVKQYVLQVHTGKKGGAGTDANVYACLNGKRGDTGIRQLKRSKSHKNKFEKGQMDEFIIEAVDLSVIESVKVGHDGKGAGDGWFLDKIVVSTVSETNTDIVFPCNRWLAKDEDDGKLERLLYPSGSSQTLATTKYQVSVKTGDIKYAGTNSNVFICLHGKKADTGQFKLRNPDNGKTPFERGRTDIFNVEAQDIGDIKKIRIGHDGDGAGDGWYLEEVTVTIASKGQIYIFDANRWIAKDEEDGELEIELYPNDVKTQQPEIAYEIEIVTGDVKNAGTDANVFVQIYGESGKSETHNLRNKSDNFEKGMSDVFKIEDVDVGRIRKIRVGHDNKGMGAGWFLDSVKITKPKTDKTDAKSKRRKSNTSSSRKSDDEAKSARTMTKLRSKRKHSKTKKSIKSKKKTNSDSDDDETSKSSVTDSEDLSNNSKKTSSKRKTSLKNKGKRKLSKQRSSTTSSRKSKSTKTDSESDDDTSDSSHSTSKKDSKNSARRKSIIAKPKNNKTMKRSSLKRKKSNVSKKSSNAESDTESGSDTSMPKNKDKNKSKSDSTKSRQKFETYNFVVQRWFDKHEDDGNVVRELTPTEIDGKTVKKSDLNEVEYVVIVFTGDVSGAGTDSNIFMNLYGELGDTGERQLKESNNRNKFERNQQHEFNVDAIDLGLLTKLKIRHDNQGVGAAWYLDKVTVLDTNTERTYIFPCEEWFDVKKGDGQISRTLIPLSENRLKRVKSTSSLKDEVALEQKGMTVSFDVKLTTSKKSGAGTDANVYIIIHGTKDDTGHIPLKHSKTHRNKFESGNTDEFVVDAVDIGDDLKKIVIGHDDTGLGSNWHLEKVEIDSASLGMKWVFPCDRWLAKNKDDGLIEREIFPDTGQSESFEPRVPYEFKVYTTDKRNAGTSAEVFVQLIGTKDSHTERISLCSDKKERKSLFNRNSSDMFIHELEEIGDLKRLRVGHDNAGFTPGWHLDKIEVRKLLQKEQGTVAYLFPCDRWLAKDEEDGLIQRDLAPSKRDTEQIKRDGSIKHKSVSMTSKGVQPNIEYEVRVTTSDDAYAGTDSNVTCIMYGSKGDSGIIPLKKSETNFNKFERGQEDVFLITCPDLGELFKVQLSHDDALIKSDWKVDRVEILNMKTDQTYAFEYNNWIKKNSSGRAEATIFVDGYDEMESTRSSKSITSAKHTPRNSTRMSNQSERHSEQEDSGTGRKGSTPSNKEIAYTLIVTTGNEPNAGTTASIWLRLYGVYKNNPVESDKIYVEPVPNSSRHPTSARRGHKSARDQYGLIAGITETFSLSASDVGNLTEVEIGVEIENPKDDWFLESFEICQPTKGKRYCFDVNKWFSKSMKSAKHKRKFFIDDDNSDVHRFNPQVPVKMMFHTDTRSAMDASFDVVFQVFGSDAVSEEQAIANKQGGMFHGGKVDKIKTYIDDVGDVKSMRIKIKSADKRESWILDKVKIERQDVKSVETFLCGQEIFASKKYGPAFVDLSPADSQGFATKQRTDYVISVKTSDKRGAGTDANVLCVIFGERESSSGELELKYSETNRDKFERGNVDVFQFENIISLGQIRRVRIWHDNKGAGASWHLEGIAVEDVRAEKTYEFECNDWLSLTEGDGKLTKELVCSNLEEESEPKQRRSSRNRDKPTTYEISITTGDKRHSQTEHDVSIVLHGKRISSDEFLMENSSRNSIFERYMFPVRCWIPVSTSKKRGLDVNCAKIDENSKHEKSQARKSVTICDYEITVFTVDERGAGTDANVFITIFGKDGVDCGQRALKQKGKNLFERGQVDVFSIESCDLGKLKKILVEHDGSGLKSDWKLDRIEIRGSDSKIVVFPCDKTLKAADDECASIELYPAKY